MKLHEYFANTNGRGVLATADSNGRVDAAIYSKPHMQDDGTLAFVMRNHLTHKNTLVNPNATYLFMEDGPHYHGVRLFLKKLREDDDPELIATMTRRHLSPAEDQAKGPKYVVYFQVEKILPLIGAGDPGVTL
ncbi:MAG: pyridoxamine 5'-phosphate oxidase [Deltaproteobacteria bacterium CG_4_10_14_3_um_filter_60_8]|nr:MAG: pyridoxamine 5'-phosphate oxidase [Desulfobacterales bacterium CG2_30_60_27]PIY20601.1 MAG: pyridoxamine 5'-phosphate oxidase [Deltaproteobacteria bacterium CG_4_10_14_3_um_filter_60_8]